jgi:carboxyl-terminal processing protease
MHHPNRFQKTSLIALAFLLAFPSVNAISLSMAQASGAQARVLECKHLPLLFQAFLRGHYSMKAMSEEVRNRTVEQFIKSLDPSRTLLLQEDVEALRGQLGLTFKSMSENDCSPLEKAHALIVQRAEADLKLVKEWAKPDFKIDDGIELNLDPEKRGYPKTEAERKELLKKLVHFQMSNYQLADTKMPEAARQLVHRYELVIKRLNERRTKNELPSIFAESFASSLDPHSAYMTPDNHEDFQINMNLTITGIGATLSSQDGFTVIDGLLPGGGAEKSKLLRPKDKIMSVSQEGKKPVSVMDMDLRDVVKMIRGPKGTKVTLTVLRQGEQTETFQVTIVRDVIDIKDEAAKITYENRDIDGKKFKIAVLELPSFYGGGRDENARSAYLDVKRLITEARDRKADGLVLDLSKNGGGLLEDAVRISGLFIRKGPIVATKDSARRTDILSDEDEEIQWPGPVLVLTSHLSASASEILAGALKDYNRALIVGTDHTFGKGTVQVLSGLPAGLGALKVTTGMFFLPGGDSTQHKGVSTHVQIPSLYASEELGERSMDYSLPPQSTQKFLGREANVSSPLSQWKPLDLKLIPELSKRSNERVKKEKGFETLLKEVEEAKQTKGVVKLGDLRKRASKKDNLAKKDRKEREQKMKDIEAPFVREGVNILVDYINLSARNSVATTNIGGR